MDEEFIESIAPDVLGVLEKRGFFEALDNLLAPEDDTVLGEKCKGGHPRSLAILNDLQFYAEEIDESCKCFISAEDAAIAKSCTTCPKRTA